MGFDPDLSGIMITVLMETALITPPIGVNLYIVQGIRTKGGDFNDTSVLVPCHLGCDADYDRAVIDLPRLGNMVAEPVLLVFPRLG